jgi:hypothetical protein
MNFLPGTHIRVLTPTPEFTCEEFRIVETATYTVLVKDSNLETYPISPLVIAQRLREGKLKVTAYPWHPSHVHMAEYRDSALSENDPRNDGGRWVAVDQCSRCLLRIDEAQIQEPCFHMVTNDDADNR